MTARAWSNSSAAARSIATAATTRPRHATTVAGISPPTMSPITSAWPTLTRSDRHATLPSELVWPRALGERGLHTEFAHPRGTKARHETASDSAERQLTNQGVAPGSPCHLAHVLRPHHYLPKTLSHRACRISWQ